MSGFLDKFRNVTPVIIGSGPTTFDYDDLDALKGPIFFINDAVFLGDRPDRYFFTHHPEVKRWLSLESTYIFAEARLCAGRSQFVERLPNGRYVPIKIIVDSLWPYVAARVLYKDLPPCMLDKDHLATERIFSAHIGSITTLIHFLWFCGATRVLGIGIHPGYQDLRHDPRIQHTHLPRSPGGYCLNLPEIVWNQEQYLKFFKIEAEYWPSC